MIAATQSLSAQHGAASQQIPTNQGAASAVASAVATATTTTTSAAALAKIWSNITSIPEDGGQGKNFSVQQSPFFPQEFPKLAGGNVQQEGIPKPNIDVVYGPGPSLRPQTEGSWGRGTLQPVQGGPSPNNGSGVNGQQDSPPISDSPNQGVPRVYPTPPAGIIPHVRGLSPGPIPVVSNSNGAPNQPGSLPPQYRMIQPYVSLYQSVFKIRFYYMYSQQIYTRGGAYQPANFPGPGNPYPPGALPLRQPFPYPDNR